MVPARSAGGRAGGVRVAPGRRGRVGQRADWASAAGLNGSDRKALHPLAILSLLCMERLGPVSFAFAMSAAGYRLSPLFLLTDLGRDSVQQRRALVTPTRVPFAFPVVRVPCPACNR